MTDSTTRSHEGVKVRKVITPLPAKGHDGKAIPRGKHCVRLVAIGASPGPASGGGSIKDGKVLAQGMVENIDATIAHMGVTVVETVTEPAPPELLPEGDLSPSQQQVVDEEKAAESDFQKDR